MIYEFTTDKVGSMNLKYFHNDGGQNLKLEGVDAQISDAGVILGGINQLLGIVNFQNEYNPIYAVRTVNQNVVEQQ